MDARQYYTDLILDLAKRPSHAGAVSSPAICCKGGNPSCGDQVSFTVSEEGTTLKSIRFQAQGCIISKASAEVVSSLCEGKTIANALEVTPELLLEELGGMIDLRMDCALLPLKVLRQGILNYQSSRASDSAPRPSTDNS